MKCVLSETEDVQGEDTGAGIWLFRSEDSDGGLSMARRLGEWVGMQSVDMADDGAAKRLGKAMAVSVDGGVEMMVAERGIVGLLVVNRDS